ncbi:AIPR family protein [Deinococcus sp. 12RED42]|uniref:AIPR family protein n=1 Tax=Deinococcus sp. 12RED42 TaxID=2745872 RepID=UPI001E5D22E3|nr:AIPR family protein [Deinococcus sp. 12RED42]MCD0164660.1 AIPR family protein [Deinococcus sp. 12RED42]
MPTNEQILLERALDQRRLDFAPDQSIQDFFEYFTAECVLYGMNIGADKIEQGNVDGKGDGGVDSFYCFLNDELVSDKELNPNKVKNKIDLYVIQSKFTNGFQGIAVQKLSDAIEMMLDLSIEDSTLRKNFRPKLVKKIAQFRDLWKKITLKPYAIHIHAYYCANSDEVHPNVRDKAVKIETDIGRLGSTIKCKFHFTGAKDLIGMSHRISRIESASLELAENPLNTKQGGYIAVTSIENYYNFITENDKLRHALFDMNVRDYQGRTDVNIKIEETLSYPGQEDFWWLNNGVSVIASGVRSSNKVLTLDYPQIVNGLQTSYEIYKSMKTMSPEVASKNILIRVVEIPLENKESRDKIIRATNSQTQLPPSSFRSTEDIHRYIESYFKDNNLFYDRRRSYYSNMGAARDQIVSIEFLVQCVMAIILGLPYRAMEQEDIYSENNPIYPKVFNDINLPTYLNCVLLVKICERFAIDKGFKYDPIGIKFYLAYVTAGLTARSVAINDNQMSKMQIKDIDEAILQTAYTMLNQQFISRDNFGKMTPFDGVPDLTSQCKAFIKQTLTRRVYETTPA